MVRDLQQDQKLQKIVNWLSPTEFPAQQADLIKRREQDTGQWFLDTDEFKEWLHSKSATLFCPGIPGAGKTMLAAITANHILQTEASNDVGLAYIYCNYKSNADVDASGLLAALLKQIAQSQSTTDGSISDLYEQHTKHKTRPSFQEISTALQSLFKKFSAVYIIIDALDECSNRDGTSKELLGKLRDIQQEADVRLMVTSRFIPDIEADFVSTPTIKIRASSADVKQFVKGQIHRLPNCIRRDSELQAIVENGIVEAVDGM